MAGVSGGPASSSCFCPSLGQCLDSWPGQRWAPGPSSVHQPRREARGGVCEMTLTLVFGLIPLTMKGLQHVGLYVLSAAEFWHSG